MVKRRNSKHWWENRRCFSPERCFSHYSSKPVTRPERLFLCHGKQAVAKMRGNGSRIKISERHVNAGNLASQKAALLLNQLQLDLVAIGLAQEAAHIAQPIDQAKLLCLDAGPEQPREQILVFRKLGSAAFLHHVDKGFVDFKLQGFQPLDVC